MIIQCNRIIKALYFTIIFILSITFTYGQKIISEGHTQKKIIIVDENISPINKAEVLLLNKLYYSNKKGEIEFSQNLLYNTKYEIIISKYSFKDKKNEIIINNDIDTIILTYNELKEVNITAYLIDFGNLEIRRIGNDKSPTVTGSLESTLTYQAFGLKSNNELSSKYSVRGGNFDENLVYVNNIEIYRPSISRSGQTEGLSFINSDMISNIEFSSGAFESKYGDKISSVLSVQYNKPKEFSSKLQISFTGMNFHSEGLSKDARVTYNTGLRIYSPTTILSTFDQSGNYSPFFSDFQNYFTLKVNDKSLLSFLSNINRNVYRFEPYTQKTSFGSINEAYSFNVFYEGSENFIIENYTNALSLFYKANKKFEMSNTFSHFYTNQEESNDVTAYYSLDRLEQDNENGQQKVVLYNVGVGGFGKWNRNYFKSNSFNYNLIANYKKNKLIELEYGITAKYETLKDKISEWKYQDSAGFLIPSRIDSVAYTNPQLQEYQFINLFENRKSNISTTSIKASTYFQSNINLLKYNNIYLQKYDSVINTIKGLKINTGIRANYWSFNNEIKISPRIIMKYYPVSYYNYDSAIYNRNLNFKLAFGIYNQEPTFREYLFQNGHLNNNYKMQTSYQAVLGSEFEFKFLGRDFNFYSEIYYKYTTRANPYDIDNLKIIYYGVNNANIISQGIDIKLNSKLIQNLDSWFNLSIMKSILKFNSVIDDDFEKIYIKSEKSNYINKNYITPTDQRISFSMFLQDQMPSSWNTSKIKWDSFKMSLNAIFNTGFSFLDLKNIINYNSIKDIPRTPRYLRFDIGFIKEFDLSKFHKIQLLLKEASLSFEIYNLLDINNVVSYNFIKAVNNKLYAIPNNLTSRTINFKLSMKF